jgi:hypothetical protein
MTERVTVRVLDLFRITNEVHIGNRIYRAGDTFTIPADSVARWLTRGEVELVPDDDSAAPSSMRPQQRTRENTLDHLFPDH